MKANRKFVQADEAVSPVIAVILMVAITVVLAATVFVLVSDIGSNTGSSAATISWNPDESADRITVVSASQNADWFRLTVQIDSCTITPAGAAVRGYAGAGVATSVAKNIESAATGAPMNAASATTACGAASAQRVGTGAAKVTAGDYIDFCFGPAGGAEVVTNVKVSFTDTTANAQQHSHTFTNIARCP